MPTEGLAYLFFWNQERVHSALKDAIQKAGQGAGLGSPPGADGKRPQEGRSAPMDGLQGQEPINPRSTREIAKQERAGP